jgi:endonuclease/exonuclease/phosphatase family metal-dependent hydrolase
MRAALFFSLVIVGCGGGKVRTPESLPPGGQVTVATYNLYLGADLMTLFTAMGNPGPAVAGIFRDVQASDPPARMDAVAAQLATAPPELIALQEVALWRTQQPADGTASPAMDVRFDFLQLVVDGLARRGLTYTIAAVRTNSDVEATGDAAGGAVDVRFTDRDAILVREGVSPGATSQNDFEVVLKVPTSTPLGTVSVRRGWVALDVLGLRFLNTHLEAAADPIRDAQAAQLLVDTTSTQPIVVIGDFNFAPGSLPYDSFRGALYEDKWPEAAPNDPGPTCCQAADLRNAESMLSERIDLVWTRGGDFRAVAGDRMGETPADKTASGLWPSDHAGVRLTLQKP